MYDSMHSSKTWPCDYVKDILSRFLNMLQCSAGLGLEIADWKNVEMCFAKDIPQQQPGDTWNCGIFVLLMMELIAKNEDMCFDKFPFSLQDMHLVRRRLILNIKKFNIPRIQPELIQNNDGGSTCLGFDTSSKTEIKTLLADEDSTKKA